MAHPFRVILVGAGPVGMIAAHVFAAAGLDFVLLERDESVVASNGSNLAAYPHTLRVFDQLGLLPVLSRIKSTMKHTTTVSRHDGSRYNTSFPYDWCVENHGRGIWFFHQPELLKTLFDALSEADQERIQTGRHVVDIQTTSSGVVVHCEDGSTEKGSIVVGVDGAQGGVSSIMRSRALEESADTLVNDEKPFLATYRALWGTTPIIQDIESSEAWECHGSGVSSQFYIGRGRAWFFVYEKLAQPTREPQLYTKQVRDSFARKLSSVKLTDNMCFREVYPASHSCGMADLSEGQLRTLSWKRIVLVGDAASQQTPNYGMGFNTGVQDIVVLANRLRRLAGETGNGDTSTEAVQDAFKMYEIARHEDVADCLAKSARGTRLQAWHNWTCWSMDRYIVPLSKTTKSSFTRTFSPIISRGHVLEFLEENDHRAGAVQWVHTRDIGQSKPQD